MTDRSIAYFSMEVALAPGIPTYAGGLGVLAGDTLRSAADMRLPMVGVSLLSRKGYFRQRIDEDGRQFEVEDQWCIEDHLREESEQATVVIEDRTVHVRGWRYEIIGCSGHVIPVFLLDTDLPENAECDRRLTDWLYGGDQHFRLCQEVVLGIGGVRLLRALSFDQIQRFHMNEGHASLLTLELLDRAAAGQGRRQITHEDLDAVRKQCVFTTHTPVPAGHDQFPMELVRQVLGRKDVYEMKDVFCCEGVLNLTYLALNLSHYVNGVAKRHGLVSQHMFGRYVIDAITNGVHAATWTGPAVQMLFDRHVPGWRDDNYSLRSALGIPPKELWLAHQQQKQTLLQHVRDTTGVSMDGETLTFGFARRMTEYKRPTLLFQDCDRLKRLAEQADGLQLILAGKAHPHDDRGKELVSEIIGHQKATDGNVRIVFLENYDFRLGQLITSGVDVWLNTPEPPLEASGTSGMKAALNGVPSLSVPDGWWLEGCVEGLTGWAIGEDAIDPTQRTDGTRDAQSLYDKLEYDVIPAYCHQRDSFIDIMRHAIALNGAFFNTQRMLSQYVVKAYFS